MVEHALLHTSTPGATGADDGEKLLTEIDGRDRIVRLVGVDAPEPEGDNGEPECFFEESRDYLARMLKGRTVYVEKDQTDRDGKDRLMRYVWFVGKSDGKAYLVNERMAEDGYVVLKDEEDDERYEDRLRDAEERAKAAELGLWDTCEGAHVAVTDVEESDQDDNRPATNPGDGGGAAVPTSSLGTSCGTFSMVRAGRTASVRGVVMTTCGRLGTTLREMTSLSIDIGLGDDYLEVDGYTDENLIYTYSFALHWT